MNSHEFSELSRIIQEIQDDGNLNEDRLEALEQALKSDGVVDRQEIELLFQVNQQIGQRDAEFPRWTEVFVENVARLVVMDLESPGSIDESEGNWLADVFDRYRAGNASEAKLFAEIRRLAKEVHGRFAEQLAGFGTDGENGTTK